MNILSACEQEVDLERERERERERDCEGCEKNERVYIVRNTDEDY